MCGFYVAQADAKLFNQSPKVVLARDGEQTSITMASDCEGDPKVFSLVVPVPTVVAHDDSWVVDNHLLDEFDAYSAPLLTKYLDVEPCAASPGAFLSVPCDLHLTENADCLGDVEEQHADGPPVAPAVAILLYYYIPLSQINRSRFLWFFARTATDRLNV